MKRWIKNSLAAALALAIGAGAAIAQAAPWGDCGGGHGRMHGMAAQMNPADISARATARLASLQTALALKTDQAVAWEQFKAVMQEKARKAADHLQAMRGEAAPATALERMERMDRFAKERMGAMGEVRQAVETFYAVLDPAQKRTFDEQFSGFGPGDMGPRGMRPHRMGPGQGARSAG